MIPDLPTEPHRVAYSAWIAAVFGWDGVLPLVVLALPTLLMGAFPGNFWVMELTTVILPVAAVILRGAIGWRAIARNHCSESFRRVQQNAFVFAVGMLFLFDVTTVLMQVLKKGALVWGPENLTALVVGAPVYLTLMSIAMYPGRSRIVADARPAAHDHDDDSMLD
ncbi:MAG: hypothetical protein HY290_06845 [Planctomycetia bacterium]|nr:hypothetical protein [Planctomycetia bacterium]